MEPTGLGFSCEGLPTGGIPVGDIREDMVLESVVCQYFGARATKSGWKYNVVTTPEEQRSILLLYRQVYHTTDIPNKEISLQFARGLIWMSRGESVDLLQFSQERSKVREGLKRKALERKEKKERESDDLCAPSILGKKRCTAAREFKSEPVSFPLSLNLVVKSEAQLVTQSGIAFGKGSGKGTGKSAGKSASLISPCWVEKDVQSVVEVIQDSGIFLEKCRVGLSACSHEVAGIEARLRRSKLQLADRELMLKESREQIEAFNFAEAMLRTTLESKTSTDSVNDQSRLEDILVKKGIEGRTLNHCADVVRVLMSTIETSEDELSVCKRKQSELSFRVSALDLSMKSAIKQVSRMREGGGAVLFPRPVAQSPSSPVVLTHTLNACPICSLWYGFFDYTSLPCGHTYHPFCLWEHLRSSSECALPHCRETFKKESLVGIGIREVVAKPIVNDVDEPTVSTTPVATLPDVTSLSGVEGSATASEVQRAVPVSSCNSEPIEKADHYLSQSSHTGAIPSNHGVTTSGVKCTVTVTCFVCGTRDATVILKKCGHQELCFHCIEGRKRCPICDESIDGWEVLKKESRVSTHLQSLAGASDILKDPLIATAVGRKKAAKAAVVKASNVKAAAVKGPDVVAADAGLSTRACFSDSNDEGMGEQHWCGDEEFSEGGKRSMFPFRGQGDDLGKTELVPALHVEEDAVTEVVCSESHEDASEPERAVEECMPNKKSKGRAGRSSYVETLNHTRVIAKSMSDLLAISPSASKSRVEKSATDAVSKGRRGRPAGGLKEAPSVLVEARGLQERVYSRVRAAPSRLTL